jgi:hypothetical protein
VRPDLYDVAGDHVAACHFHEELRGVTADDLKARVSR